MFGLSEHCLFDEQRNLLESLSDSYKGKVICSDDNPYLVVMAVWQFFGNKLLISLFLHMRLIVIIL